MKELDKKETDNKPITLVQVFSKWYMSSACGLAIGYALGGSLGLFIGFVIGTGFGLFLQKYYKK